MTEEEIVIETREKERSITMEAMNDELRMMRATIAALRQENEELKKKEKEWEARLAARVAKEAKQIESSLEEKFAKIFMDIVGVEGAVGGENTSTPKKLAEIDVKKLQEKVEKLKKEEKQKKKKKKKSKKGKKSNLFQISQSRDSLYTKSDESESDWLKSESEETSDSEVEVQRSILIREVPKIEKFNAYGQKEVKDFFEEYENYCKEKYGENKSF